MRAFISTFPSCPSSTRSPARHSTAQHSVPQGKSWGHLCIEQFLVSVLEVPPGFFWLFFPPVRVGLGEGAKAPLFLAAGTRASSCMCFSGRPLFLFVRESPHGSCFHGIGQVHDRMGGTGHIDHQIIVEEVFGKCTFSNVSESDVGMYLSTSALETRT